MDNQNGEPLQRKDSEDSFTKKCKTPCGNLYVTCSHRDYNPIEIFVGVASLNYAAQKGCHWALNYIAVACSNFLQNRIEREKVLKYTDSGHCPEYSQLGLRTCPEHIHNIIKDPEGASNADKKD